MKSAYSDALASSKDKIPLYAHSVSGSSVGLHILYSYALKFVTPSQGERTEPISCDSHTQIEVIELKL
jgi:hypothetical protein